MFLFVGPGLETWLDIPTDVVVEHWPPKAAENDPQRREGAFVSEEAAGILYDGETFNDIRREGGGASEGFAKDLLV